jgi:dienelactone hydrolase
MIARTLPRISTLAAALLVACGSPPPSAAPKAQPAAVPAKAAEPAPTETKKETAPMSPKDTAQAIVKKLVARDFDGVAATFSPKMRAEVGPPQLEAVWKNIEASSGPFEGVADVVEKHATEATVVQLTAKFSKLELEVTVAVNDASHGVDGLFVRPKNNHPYAPPAYVDRMTFTEKETTVGAAPWALPATITLPNDGAAPAARGGKGVPGVVLVHGSGPNDRDETLGGTKVFRDLAWGLAARGVAVIRYEKRTRAHGTEMAKSVDELTPKEETVEDAALAVRVLAADPAVDPKRVFVAGHSMGATFAPRVAAQAPEVAGLVLLAGSTRPLEDVILEQHRYVLGLHSDVPEEEKKKLLSTLEEQVKRVKDASLSPSTPSSELPLGIGAKYWLDLRGYDAAASAAALKKPVLALQGTRDFQVTQADFARYEKAFAGRKDATLKLLPHLNHAFVAAPPTAGPTSTPEEYDLDANVDAGVVDVVAKWVKAAARTK